MHGHGSWTSCVSDGQVHDSVDQQASLELIPVDFRLQVVLQRVVGGVGSHQVAYDLFHALVRVLGKELLR